MSGRSLDRIEKEAESSQLSLPDMLTVFDGYGGTDKNYLTYHYKRFVATLTEFDRTWHRARGVRVLDIGAHWLHQAVLWRRAGYALTAMDLPLTFDLDCVRSCAASEGITLLPNEDLERCPVLADLPDGSFNIVLFTEIIEHLSFNPVHLWKEVYRLLAPGGRIVITTPNYYAWNGRCWHWRRFLSGFGGGISVDDILNTCSYGHHWREFSKRELIRYFCLLSPDFNTTKANVVRNYYPPSSRKWTRVAERIFELVPWLRANLHLEIELSEQRHGIIVSPSW